MSNVRFLARRRLAALPNKEFIEALKINPHTRILWLEFMRRFHKDVCRHIYRACCFYGYSEGLRQIEDIAQDVYVCLVANDYACLRNFAGEHENSMFDYLKITALRQVQNRMKRDNADKRIPRKLRLSLHAPRRNYYENEQVSWQEKIADANSGAEIRHDELAETVFECLDRLLEGTPNKERNEYIFGLNTIYGMSPREIAADPNVHISAKSIYHLLHDLKVAVAETMEIA